MWNSKNSEKKVPKNEKKTKSFEEASAGCITKIQFFNKKNLEKGISKK